LTEKFGITKQWAARIVKIYKSEADFYAARAYYETNGQPLRSRNLSLDGALTLIKDWKKETQTDTKEDEPRRPRVKQVKTKVELAAELESLQEKFNDAEKLLSKAQQQAAEAADLRWQMAEKEQREQALEQQLAEKEALLTESNIKIAELERKLGSLTLKRDAEHNIIRLNELEFAKE
jgi:chromosome segregation ATPase